MTGPDVWANFSLWLPDLAMNYVGNVIGGGLILWVSWAIVRMLFGKVW